MSVGISSNRGSLELGPFYLGWNNVPYKSVNGDYGDETFGVAIGNLYLGCYYGTGWCFGTLDENGVLID